MGPGRDRPGPPDKTEEALLHIESWPEGIRDISPDDMAFSGARERDHGLGAPQAAGARQAPKAQRPFKVHRP